jgi:hypothetical protein
MIQQEATEATEQLEWTKATISVAAQRPQNDEIEQE